MNLEKKAWPISAVMAVACLAFLAGCDQQPTAQPVTSYLDVILEQHPDLTQGRDTVTVALTKELKDGPDGYGKVEGSLLSVWHFPVNADGLSAARREAAYWFKTPTLVPGMGINVFKRLQKQAWDGFGLKLSAFKDPMASRAVPLLRQIRMIASQRKKPEQGAVEVTRTRKNTLVLVSTMEDEEVFIPGMPTPAWSNSSPPWSEDERPDLTGTTVLVRQLAPRNRKPERLGAYWVGLLKACGAVINTGDFVAAAPAVNQLPEDCVTALLLDRTDPVPAADLEHVPAQFHELVKPAELVQIYTLEAGMGSSYERPRSSFIRDTAQGESPDALDFTQKVKEALKADDSTAASTRQSPIIECLGAIAAHRSFIKADALKLWPDYPERIHRRVLLISDLQQNSTDTHLEISSGRFWWMDAKDAWETFSKSTYWAARKPDLKGVEVLVYQLRRNADTATMERLRSFWQKLLEDAGATVIWEQQPVPLSSGKSKD